MLPAYLVLLQRIATPDEPADVESQLLQLRAWVELERENGRLYYSVQEQQVVEYAIAAASRSLDKLASTTGEIDYGDMRSLATCLLMILDLCCVVMEEVVTQPYANSTGLQYVAYLESVRKQVPPTGNTPEWTACSFHKQLESSKPLSCDNSAIGTAQCDMEAPTLQ